MQFLCFQQLYYFQVSHLLEIFLRKKKFALKIIKHRNKKKIIAKFEIKPLKASIIFTQSIIFLLITK